MSHFEVKPCIWKPKDSELTITLNNDRSNPYGIFGHNNFDNHILTDNESNDLISDIQLDETFNIFTFDCNNLEVESCVDLQTDFNECSSKTKQENTNFIRNENDGSFSISDKHSNGFREFLLPTEELPIERNLSRFDREISRSCDYETNDLKIDETDSKVFNDLLKRFSKRVSRVAIKTEVKSFIKHHTKKVIKEMTVKIQKISPVRSVALELQPISNKTISNEDIKFRSLVKVNYDTKVTMTNNESDEIIIVESILPENKPIEKVFTCSHELTNFRISSNENENYTISNVKCLSPIDVEPLSSVKEYVFDKFEDDSLCYKISPKHRAIATSPINLSELIDEPNNKILNLLNCMSRQSLKKSNYSKPIEKHKKIKSNSSSLFQRLFSKTKSKSKDSNYLTSPEYLSSLSKASSILSLDKHENYSQPTYQKESITGDNYLMKNDWLEIDHYSVNYESQEPANKVMSCQVNSKFFNNQLSKFESTTEEKSKLSHLSNISCSDLSGDNAVFIID